MAKFLDILFLVLLAYFVILTFYYLALAIIALFEERKKIHQHHFEDYASLSTSTFTLPVSVVIPAHNEEDWILDSLKALLNLKYPEFELIVVDDGSTDNTPNLLREELKLEPIDRSIIEYFHAGKIREVFKSTRYPNVTVVSKFGGFKKAGAVNVGLELARFPYVCVIDADTIIEPDALLKVMAHVEKDPDNIIGAGSYFGLVNGFRIKNGEILERRFSFLPIIAYQNIEYIRSFISNRTAWNRYNASPNVAGGFGIWRRDILLDLGGYATDFSSEDIELTFRAQDYMVENKKRGYKILALPYFVGWTEGPSSIGSLIMQRDRWQRVINETMWKYRHMIFSPRHGIFAFLTLPYYLFYETLGVFFEITSIALVVWGAVTGVLTVKVFLPFLVLMILSQAVFSLLSIFNFTRNQKVFRLKYISYLVLLSFLEFFWYHWLLVAAKISGTFSYLKGVTTYDQYERQKHG